VNGFVIATSVAAAAFGQIFAAGAGRGSPPKPFDDDVTLPGKVPATTKSIVGGWSFFYLLQKATFEGGEQSDATFNTILFLYENGTYRLNYNARWNLPRPVVVGNVPVMVGQENTKGRVVNEEGKFSLSGEVLLLEPGTVKYMELQGNTVVSQQTIANENHTLIVRLDKAKRLSVAGRCASYQVDPVCRDTPIVWYPMRAQLGGRYFGREPK
jgi:hypothetical protein